MGLKRGLCLRDKDRKDAHAGRVQEIKEKPWWVDLITDGGKTLVFDVKVVDIRPRRRRNRCEPLLPPRQQSRRRRAAAKPAEPAQKK